MTPLWLNKQLPGRNCHSMKRVSLVQRMVVGLRELSKTTRVSRKTPTTKARGDIQALKPLLLLQRNSILWNYLKETEHLR